MTRQEFRELVACAVARYGEVELRGSFAHDDFHFDPLSRTTRSDVDLVSLGASAERRSELVKAVSDAVETSTGLKLKVSIHPERNFEALSASDARFLALAEYLRHERAVEGKAADFLRAKVALLALRAEPRERYESVGRRLGDDALQAVSVKLGYTGLFARKRARRLLLASSFGEARRLAAFMHDDGLGIRAAYKQELMERTTVSIWLRRYIAGTLQC